MDFYIFSRYGSRTKPNLHLPLAFVGKVGGDNPKYTLPETLKLTAKAPEN